jgi:hypothetical protein
MRHHTKKTRFFMPVVLLTLGLSLVAVMALSPATAAENAMKRAEPCQGQNQKMCPATPEKSTCVVTVDCPPIKSPGKTVCQTTIDCPGKQAEPEKEKKSE